MVKGVYIGLGSNIEQPFVQIKNAISALHDLPYTKVIKDSGYYKSTPMGPDDQPDYVNAVVEIETEMDANELLKCCQAIEKNQGRVKTRHWGERSIDLDILLYADKIVNSDDLVIPHPGVCLRDFVYLPLLKLSKELKVPGVGLLHKMVRTDQELNKEEPSKNNQGKDKSNNNKTDYSCQYAGNIDR